MSRTPVSRLTPAQRSERARLAALTRWSKTNDRSGATKAARDGFLAKLAHEVDPDSRLMPDERARRVEMARQAHYARMRLQRGRGAA